MVAVNWPGSFPYIVSATRVVGHRILYKIIGFAMADSMQDLAERLDLARLCRTLPELRISVFFTDIRGIKNPAEVIVKVQRTLENALHTKITILPQSLKYAVLNQISNYTDVLNAVQYWV